jgi:hypothetical protein
MKNEAIDARLEHAEGAIRRVRVLHSHGLGTDTCNGCGECWPCSTIDAIDALGNQS